MTIDKTNCDQRKITQARSALQDGQWSKAADICHQILTGNPRQLEANYYLGLFYQNDQQLERAISHFETVIALSAGHTDALTNLGAIHETRKCPGKAILYYSQAVQSSPSRMEARYNLGRLQRLSGDTCNAVTNLVAANHLTPDCAPVLLELGLALKTMGRLPEAQKHLEQALVIAPENPAIPNVLGNIHQSRGEIEQAIGCYKQAIHLNPDFSEAYNNLGTALIARGDVAAALSKYRKALALRPGWSGAKSNILLAENYISEDQSHLFEIHKKLGASFSSRIQATIRNATRNPNRKIRIGYISPDFRYHSVAYFIKPLFTHYDRRHFEVIGFSDTGLPDGMTQELQSLAGEWHRTYGLSDNDLYRLVQQCNIDILVDLAGHTANNRLTVFAEQAAPIQVSYLGYPNTTGIPAIQYRITDQWADPPGEADMFHTEKLIRLPDGFLCYTALPEAPEITTPPSENNGYTTYGSFNVLAKISDKCVDTWCEILKQDPQSRLILKSAGLQDNNTKAYITRRFQVSGLTPDRLDLIARTTDFRSHMALYNQVDISLDTFPYNGTTTSCESLWMGVPVITLKGNRHAGRVGHSLLQHLGMDECIGSSCNDYISKAVSLARAPEHRRNLRKTLRLTMNSGIFCDGPEFTRSIESAYRDIFASALPFPDQRYTEV